MTPAAELPSPEDRARMVGPPIVSAALPGVGGRFKARPEDFVVEEIPAYEADGEPDRHALLRLDKRSLTTSQALDEVARQLGVGVRDIGCAGLKDKDAVTSQRISVPVAALEHLERFDHPAITLGEPALHSSKLRRGHSKGNRFVVVLRDLDVELDEAMSRARLKHEALQGRGGMDNVYGSQRFGHEGRNLEKGLSIIKRGKRPRPGDLILSAAQSALFNLWVLLRRERGLERKVLFGDMLKKTDTGGMFTCADEAADQTRLDAGELVVTGPMFGGRMRGPTLDSPAEQLEDEVLARVGVTREMLQELGRKVPGTRREAQIQPAEFALDRAEAVDDLGPGLRMSFSLPPGSYATVLLAELMCG